MQDELIYQVAEEVRERGYSVTLRDIPKVNGNKMGLSLNPGESGIARTFYEEEFQHMALEGFSVVDMANHFLEQSLEMPDLGDIGRMVDKDYVLEHAQLCLAKTDWNQVFFAGTPHVSVEGTDLSAYARIRISDDASMVPRYEQLKSLDITGEELLQAAQENSRQTYKVESMESVLARMIGGDPATMNKSGIYVITNDSALYGASAITDAETMAAAYDLVGGEAYVIPSSVHECLIISANIAEEEVNAMINSVNSEEVRPEERLSDHAYRFDGQKLTETKTQDRELVAGRSR